MRSRRLWIELIKRQRPRDPSLKDQLSERSNLVDSARAQSYLEACQRAPNASEGTKRKWKRALGLS
jgi:hypothetical protein